MKPIIWSLLVAGLAYALVGQTEAASKEIELQSALKGLLSDLDLDTDELQDFDEDEQAVQEWFNEDISDEQDFGSQEVVDQDFGNLVEDQYSEEDLKKFLASQVTSEAFSFNSKTDLNSREYNYACYNSNIVSSVFMHLVRIHFMNYEL